MSYKKSFIIQSINIDLAIMTLNEDRLRVIRASLMLFSPFDEEDTKLLIRRINKALINMKTQRN
jgi:hypothetical protein